MEHEETPRRHRGLARRPQLAAGTHRLLRGVLIVSLILGAAEELPWVIGLGGIAAAGLAIRMALVCVRSATKRRDEQVAIRFLQGGVFIVAAESWLLAAARQHGGRDAIRNELLTLSVGLACLRRFGLWLYGFVWRAQDTAAGLVLLGYLSLTVPLLAYSSFAVSALLRVTAGSEDFQQAESIAAALALLGPGTVQVSVPEIPSLMLNAIGVAGWVLLILWVAPLLELFPDRRDAVEEQLRQAQAPLRSAALGIRRLRIAVRELRKREARRKSPVDRNAAERPAPA